VDVVDVDVDADVELDIVAINIDVVVNVVIVVVEGFVVFVLVMMLVVEVDNVIVVIPLVVLADSCDKGTCKNQHAGNVLPQWCPAIDVPGRHARSTSSNMVPIERSATCNYC